MEHLCNHTTWKHMNPFIHCARNPIVKRAHMSNIPIRLFNLPPQPKIAFILLSLLIHIQREKKSLNGLRHCAFTKNSFVRALSCFRKLYGIGNIPQDISPISQKANTAASRKIAATILIDDINTASLTPEFSTLQDLFQSAAERRWFSKSIVYPKNLSLLPEGLDALLQGSDGGYS